MFILLYFFILKLKKTQFLNMNVRNFDSYYFKIIYFKNYYF